MTNQFRTVLTLGVVAMALTGCNSGPGTYKPKAAKKAELQEIKPDEGAALLPLKVGNRWVYTVESQQSAAGQPVRKTDELAFTITEVTPKGEGQLVVMDATLNGEPTDKQAWLIDSKGIHQAWIKDTSRSFTPPMPMIAFPLTPDAVYEWKGKGPTMTGIMGDQSQKLKILKTQLVDTDAGQVSAIPVEIDSDFKDAKAFGKSRSTSYWAKGIGLVRYRQESILGPVGGQATVQAVQVIRLKLHSLK